MCGSQRDDVDKVEMYSKQVVFRPPSDHTHRSPDSSGRWHKPALPREQTRCVASLTLANFPQLFHRIEEHTQGNSHVCLYSRPASIKHKTVCPPTEPPAYTVLYYISLNSVAILATTGSCENPAKISSSCMRLLPPSPALAHPLS